MSIDIKKFEEFLNSNEGKAYIEKENQKHLFQLHRFNRFDEWLKHNDFDNLLYRLINKHDEEYREKCWHNGCEAHPNNVLQFLFDYLNYSFDTINVTEIDSDFMNQIWFFKGYYFQVIYGQGSFIRIYNKSDMRLILQV